MNTLKVVHGISLFVIFVAVLVMSGWFFDIDLLKSILPQWVTMKFLTALCFLLSGIMVCMMTKAAQGRQTLALGILPVPILTISIILSLLLTSVVLNRKTGIEDLFVKEEAGAIYTSVPGQPSVGTMLCFISIVCVGILFMYYCANINKMKHHFRIFGCIVGLGGMTAIVGYIFDIPVLYYTIKDLSTAMALHTAILFLMLGLSLILLSRQEG